MPEPVEAAYFSAVLVANALSASGHPKATDAVALKDALAQALTHPDKRADPAFTDLWNKRKAFSELKLDGAHADTFDKHAKLLAQISL